MRKDLHPLREGVTDDDHPLAGVDLEGSSLGGPRAGREREDEQCEQEGMAHCRRKWRTGPAPENEPQGAQGREAVEGREKQ